MAGKQAKILSVSGLNDLLIFASCTRHPIRNRTIVLLSAKAGLRAGEIAKLTWDMVLDATDNIGSVIELRDHAAKKNSGRLIPVHPDLRQALSAYRSLSPGVGPVIRSERGGHMTPLSIVVWFNRAFHNIGLSGCSSHSANALLSHVLLGSCTKRAARCATCSYSRSSFHSDNSTIHRRRYRRPAKARIADLMIRRCAEF
jgi:integrase/recombinase XerD